ncbi:MAG: cytochrome c [Phycisphaerales bacterium]
MFVPSQLDPPRTVKDRNRGDQWRPANDCGLRDVGIALMWACAVMAPMLGTGGWVMHRELREREDARLAAIEAAQAYERLVAAPPGPMLHVTEAVHGRELFSTVCIACHGLQGTGVPGLGKSLVQSDFVAALSDGQLHQFLVVGRPNASPVGMPPQGGPGGFTDGDLRDLVTFVRGLQDPRRMPELPAAVVAPPTEAETAAALAAAGGDPELAQYIANGNKLFHSTCIACHGKGGVGVQGNGKALVANPFIRGLDDDGLLGFIRQGRSPGDPKNTTGIQMPPKGGNPALSDDDVLDIIAYLRTLQSEKPAAAVGN